MMHTPHRPSLLVLALAMLLGAGCEMQRRVVSTNPWDRMFRESEWADHGAGSSGGSGQAGPRNRGYAVELARFEGSDAFHTVPTLIREAREQGGLGNLWYGSSNGVTTVYAGKFRAPDSSEAKNTLRLVRSAEINGLTPYEDAEIVALASDRNAGVDRRDLRSLAGRSLYTLQIGFFDSDYGDDFRKAAEDRVDALREDGEDAYYYHGPNRSMVLVNAWRYEQAFTRGANNMDRYSNAVLLVQEKHPHNVPNGQPYTEDDDPRLVSSQHSFLVPIR